MSDRPDLETCVQTFIDLLSDRNEDEDAYYAEVAQAAEILKAAVDGLGE